MSNTVELTCTWCGGEYQRHRSQADGSRFCSNSCQGEWYSETHAGENSPHWRAGLGDPRDAPDWPEKRRSAIKRDGGRCVRCEECIKERPSIHHNVPVSAGGDNQLENLVTLCRGCHNEVHSEEYGFGLVSGYEQKIIRGEADVSQKYHDVVVTRVRKRIKRLDGREMDALENHGGLAEELREVVCEE